MQTLIQEVAPRAAEFNAAAAAYAESASGAASSTHSWTVESFEYRAFEYPAAQETAAHLRWNESEAEGSQTSSEEQESAAAAEPPFAAWEEMLAEEKSKSYEAGRSRGREEGCTDEHERGQIMQAEEARAREIERRGQLGKLVEGFERARAQYLHDVESEVVRLALAVAARILRREAQMDPLLLTGAVRVALGQLAERTRVVLKVPSTELALWQESIAHMPKLALRPEVVAGEGMRLGECVIETEMGLVDLGIRSQLSEIERGFFDRPGRAVSGVESASAEESQS